MVIDVIRATSTIVTALANGADGVKPVADLEDAFDLAEAFPNAILAGERGGRPLPGFDMGNSPEDFTPAEVKGLRVILTTTNGTQALAACTGAKKVVTASFLNLTAVAGCLLELGPPWMILCAGCNGEFGVDDGAVAGALAEALNVDHSFVSLYRSVKNRRAEMLLGSDAGQELVKVGMEKDLPFCAKLDLFCTVPTLDDDGILRG